jgi:glutathione gamma-glutamylcysteinyltransferase
VVPRSFHKRVLPKNLVALSSVQGKALFREALAQGGMESFFPLSEQFITQSQPALCSLSSLAMVLNALSYDPKRIWKGGWRWVSEEMLKCESADICGHSYDKIVTDGMNFSEFENLAHCHGVQINSYRVHGSSSSLQAFRANVQLTSCSELGSSFIIANFSRKHIGQTGDGHFSPIGGYHPAKDLVLIMDTARFKYPPFWVPLEDLWRSMSLEDEQTSETRGYFVVSTKISSSSISLLDESERSMQDCMQCEKKRYLGHLECCKVEESTLLSSSTASPQSI